ncbi:hypothetical protein IEQ34_010384 [Dendrobium chrysotoxum]|uniref:BHLH domain-containing protein n=1 Tax=Dendrobium chrysotoxum TaxID=161865 RepID=A0AAV7GM06_DENCH|nr:hypothetical protein IEQ34_010384 [Dendrobium chrysotoxum]
MRAMGTPVNGLSRSSKPTPSAVSTQIAVHEFHNSNGHPLIQNRNLQRTSSHFEPSPAATDDFFEQMLSSIPSWPELTKFHWDLTGGKQVAGDEGLPYAGTYDESSLLTARLRQEQISSGGSLVGKQTMLPISAQQQQHQLLLSAMVGSHQSPANASAVESGHFPPLPRSLGGPGRGADSDSSFKSPNSTVHTLKFPTCFRIIFTNQNHNSVIFLQGAEFSASQPQHFQQPEVLLNPNISLFFFKTNFYLSALQCFNSKTQGASMPQQNFGGSPPQAASSPATSAGANSGAARIAAPQHRVRARRGQATDPHSIAERLRRERIAERMKALQELVPNANKTDKASMLDEIIDYVKFLQLQVKVLSISRLGGAAAASPLIADIPSEGRGSPAAGSETIAATENLVAKLMEEDMGSAIQYLQGKGLCLMPISLASAISTATSPSADGKVVPGISAGGDAPPSSPSMSVLTVQSAAVGPCGDTNVSRFSGEDAAKR